VVFFIVYGYFCVFFKITMFQKNFFKRITSFAVILAIALGASITHVELAHAAALSSLSDTQSSVKISAFSDHTISFVTPTGIAAGQAISVTFPSGYATGTFSVNNFDFATSTSATCANFTDALLAAAPSGLTWGVSVATATLYITSGTAVIPANRCIQIEIGSNATSSAVGTSTMTNPSSPGSYVISIGGSFGDNGVITSNIVTDDTVSISATVQQSLTFVISTSTIYFGNLGSGATKYASSTNPLGDSTETTAHTLVVSTNAPSGYNLSVRGQTLTSQQNPANTISAIGSVATASSTGIEQFGIRATVSGGTGATIDTTYASTTAFGYDATATSSAPLAVGSGSTNATTYSLRYVANIGGTTEAGTYVANLVYVSTANF
jgi:hypothetical protein